MNQKSILIYFLSHFCSRASTPAITSSRNTTNIGFLPLHPSLFRQNFFAQLTFLNPKAFESISEWGVQLLWFSGVWFFRWHSVELFRSKHETLSALLRHSERWRLRSYESIKDHSKVHHRCSAGAAAACVDVPEGAALLQRREPGILQNLFECRVCGTVSRVFGVVCCGHSWQSSL